ncbi:MAG: DUF1622 domain-containing protein [Xanthomonadaceae bacterium]|nr:DUF1622 domain-containing protein [Xanthomonadaceae bacterium]
MEQWIDWIKIKALILVVESIGIAVILGGFVVATVVYLMHARRWTTHHGYLDFRRRSVRGLILGLEFLVAADIIRTVVVDYSLESVLTLGLIIVVRSFLVFSLHLEIEGRMPWASPEKED